MISGSYAFAPRVESRAMLSAALQKQCRCSSSCLVGLRLLVARAAWHSAWNTYVGWTVEYLTSEEGEPCRGFLLGPRIAEARAAGHTSEESDLYEWNLRTQLSVWGTSPRGGSEVEDYANREWAGLISSYYKPR